MAPVRQGRGIARSGCNSLHSIGHFRLGRQEYRPIHQIANPSNAMMGSTKVQHPLAFGPMRWALGIAVVALLSLIGCQHPGPRFDPRARKAAPPALETVALTNRINPEWLRPPTNLFTLGPGDKLEIELLDDPTSKT